MAIDVFLVEAKLLQLFLELCYVIAHLHVARFIGQNAGAQRVGSLAQLAQSEVINIAARHDAAGLLEGLEDLG